MALNISRQFFARIFCALNIIIFGTSRFDGRKFEEEWPQEGMSVAFRCRLLEGTFLGRGFSLFIFIGFLPFYMGWFEG